MYVGNDLICVGYDGMGVQGVWMGRIFYLM